jgi:hypothetical protein
MKPPKCGVHVGVAMVLMDVKAPSWLFRPDGADEMEQSEELIGGTHKKQFQRKFWKCPLAGCFRVAAHAPSEEELAVMRKPCRKCGGETEGDATRIRARNGMCLKCFREYSQEKKAARDGKTDFALVIRGGEIVPVAAEYSEASA